MLVSLLPVLLACASSSPEGELRAEVLSLPPTDVAGAVDRVRQMDDPMERGVTVELWVRQNRGRVNVNQALEMCRLAPPRDLEVCTRNLHALHLNRGSEG